MLTLGSQPSLPTESVCKRPLFLCAPAQLRVLELYRSVSNRSVQPKRILAAWICWSKRSRQVSQAAKSSVSCTQLRVKDVDNYFLLLENFAEGEEEEEQEG